MARKITAFFLSVALMSLAPGLAAGHGNEVPEGEAKAKEQAAQPSPGLHNMTGTDRMSTPGMANLRMPRMDPVRGRRLFVTKGCVACHAINGVGGHDATNLDAHTMQPMMNPFEFAAKMWAMAPAMIQAQEEALGEQILFTGDELADIIGFVHNDEAQHDFGEADLTPQARAMMNHSHGEAGSGPKAHAKEIGHPHGAGQAHGHGGAGAEGQSN